MIITLKGADFSASNIGTLSSWRITRSLGSGATYEGVTSVDKGAAFSATVTLAEGYEIGTAGVTVTMGGIVLSDVHSITGNVITITIASVTGNVLIKVPTMNTGTGDEDDPDTPTIIITDLSGYEKHYGLINSTNVWNNISEKYQHVVVPVSGSTTLELTTNANQALYFAGLKTYSTPIEGAAPNFSSDETWSKRLSCPKNTTRSWVVPNDVRYLVFITVNNTQDATPINISITTRG
jgi:hypothetical protein